MTHLERWVMSKLTFWVVIIAFFLELWRESFVFKMLPVDWTESIGITFSSLDWTNIWFVTTTHLCIKIGTHTQVLDFYHFKKSMLSLSFEPMINRLKHSWTDSITLFSSHVATSILTINKTIVFWSQQGIFFFPSCPLRPLWFIRWLWNFIFCSSAWSWIKIDGPKLNGWKFRNGRSCTKLDGRND